MSTPVVLDVAALVAFLNARLDEAAARAWAVHDVEKCDALLYEEDMAAAAARTPDCDCGYPARALREVAIKRTVTETWEGWPDYDLPPGVHDGRDDSERSRDEAVREALEAVVRAFATAWSDHADYRMEWAP